MAKISMKKSAMNETVNTTKAEKSKVEKDSWVGTYANNIAGRPIREREEVSRAIENFCYFLEDAIFMDNYGLTDIWKQLRNIQEQIDYLNGNGDMWKSKTEKSVKSPTEILKSYGWVRKADDKGPDSEDVEDGAGVESDVKVPDTPEPSDNVQDTKTGIPEDDALIEDGKKNEKMGDKEGDDIDALEEDGGSNNKLPKDMDDIDALIEKKRQQNGFYNGTPAPAVESTVPVSTMYRQTRMGEGKMDVMSQLSNPKTMTSKSTKGMAGSRKSQ